MNFKFPPRGPDYVSEAIAAVLFTKRPMEFKDIFDLVHASLRSKDLAKGGEEMLRLRSHEKLQAFVASGIATKNEKKYTGVPKMLKVFIETAAEHNAAFAAGTHVYTQPATKVSEVVSSKIRRTKLPIQKVKAARSSKKSGALIGTSTRQTEESGAPIHPAARRSRFVGA